MYTLRVEFMVPPGKIVEFENAAAQLAVVERTQRGIQGFSLWNSVGYPIHYAVLVRAESLEAIDRARRTDGFKLAVGAVGALATVSRLPEVYEVVLDTGSPGGQYLGLTDWSILGGPDGAAAFEARAKEMFALHEKHIQGWVGTRLRRSLAVPNRYLAMRYASTLEAAQPAKDPPAVLEFRRANPPEKYLSGPVTVETFRSILAVAPGQRRAARTRR